MKYLGLSAALIAAMTVSLPYSALAQANTTNFLCDTLASAKAAEYVPGVDAEGNPVAPADLPAVDANHITVVTEFPLTLDIADAVGITLPAGSELPAQLGKVQVMSNSQVIYQGKDVSPNIQALCFNRNVESIKAENAAKREAAKAEYEEAMRRYEANIQGVETRLYSGAPDEYDVKEVGGQEAFNNDPETAKNYPKVIVVETPVEKSLEEEEPMPVDSNRNLNK